MLSTKHDASKTNVRTRYMSNTLVQYTNNTCTHTAYSHRRGHLKEKPTVVADYNLYMLGVDKLDQMMSYYSFLHKSVKWWQKVFFWLLEGAVVNAYIIYKEVAWKRGATPITHLAFRRRLIQSLSEPIRSCVTPHARSGPRVAQNVERLQPVPHFLHCSSYFINNMPLLLSVLCLAKCAVPVLLGLSLYGRSLVVSCNASLQGVYTRYVDDRFRFRVRFRRFPLSPLARNSSN